jgi:hypothetical protein
VNRFTESKPGGINLTVLSVSFYPQAGRTMEWAPEVGRDGSIIPFDPDRGV